jgi:CRP-like cAMP-binding protein
MAPDPIPTLHVNRLLRRMSSSDLALLDPHWERRDLPERTDFERPNKPVKAVCFMETGIASVVARSPHGEKVEVGVIGREGMTGHIVVMGNDRSPNESYMQVAGSGLSMPAAKLRVALDESATLRPLLTLYVQTFTTQASYTALANARGRLEERLARWLLMAHDRIEGDELPLKHEFLALMLGVRRAGVTVALQELASASLIGTHRGRITVVDREGLEEAANGLYGTPEAEYKRLIGNPI